MIPLVFRVLLITSLASAILATGCAKAANERAVERLRQQIVSGEFDQIYERSSDLLKRATSKEEFVGRMQNAVKEMKAVDESLTWIDAEHRIDRFWDSYESYSRKEMKGNDTELWISITWNSGYRLCGLAYGHNEDGVGVGVIRACD